MKNELTTFEGMVDDNANGLRCVHEIKHSWCRAADYPGQYWADKVDVDQMLQHIGLLVPGDAQLPTRFTVRAVGANGIAGCYDVILTGPDIGERQCDTVI